ncbi:alpha/beta hydrolase [Flavihumibacter rivuli]|uniref:alpha/beta hydrolase n=1 Tax=Flavihumibacter rivuli TaxID=2838156 RepID=UPI001BDE0A01|nr:alpha/beta hydrolase [Flavihumibacter rivuli]ULQ57562.1 alpha/beta hydrolase [Flavihumibacter rivuli]
MKLAQKLALNYLRAKLNFTAVFSKRKAAEMAFEIFSTPFRKSKKKVPPIFDKADRNFVQVQGNRVVVYRWNLGGIRRVIVCHGFESSARNFDRYIVPLIKKGYEVIAVDAPAHGASEGRQINLPMYVQTLSEVYNHFGPIQSFMGHSFGGLAIAHFLENIHHDDSYRIALIAPATESVTAMETLFDLLQLDEGVKEEFEKLIEEKAGVPLSHFSIPRALNNIHAKVLWVHDEDDDVTPIRDVKPLIKAKPEHIEFMLTRELGHRKIYRDNKVVRKVVEFL